jgi:hypothetical protein
MKKIKRLPGHLASCDKTEHCLCVEVAYHEAGHAFIAWHLKIPVLSIDTRKTDEDLANVWMEPSDDPLIQSQVILAGPIAEMIYLKSNTSFVRDPEVQATLRTIGIVNTGKLFISVSNILIKNWNVIGYLADKILNGKSIIYKSQFLKLMRGVEVA